jgi:glucose-6-phosphate-specific signal transduction histidine kinase
VIGDRERNDPMAQPTHGDAGKPEDRCGIGNEQLASLIREVDGLKVALASRTVIGIALGIIIEREHVTESEAFQILKRKSQHSNVKLRDIAAQMAEDAQRSIVREP